MTARLTAIVVDDEGPARRRLLRLLEQVPEIEVRAELAGGAEALEHIAAHPPDVVFLDIHMPDLDGLTFATRCSRVPAIVFVTAHAEHAVRAFELASVDYLLKPVRLERLEEAVRRVRARRDVIASPPLAEIQEAEVPRVIAHERGSTVIVDARLVTRFRASDKYTAFFADGRELLTEESLVVLEERLAPFGFLRVHRSELVRLSAVRAHRVEDGVHSVRLEDGQVASVSRRLAATLREKLAL